MNIETSRNHSHPRLIIEERLYTRLVALAERARANSFGFLDLLPLLRSHRGEAIYFDHCHPMATANAWIGEALAQCIRSEFLTPGGKSDPSLLP